MNKKQKHSKLSKIDIINKRIKNEYCCKVSQQLNDNNLLNKYKKCKSVEKNINVLKNVLDNNNIDKKIQNDIVNEYIIQLIPPGTKGVVRGNKFNTIVKKFILSLDLPNDRFSVKFEKQHKKFQTSEIPDWYIYDKINKKILIGMNQLDLWNGGQQINRGSKYLINNINNTKHSKLLCVVCNFIKIKSNKNKVFELFDTGFKNNTLCYINGIESIVNSYFCL